jgi:hypothetical protein
MFTDVELVYVINMYHKSVRCERICNTWSHLWWHRLLCLWIAPNQYIWPSWIIITRD